MTSKEALENWYNTESPRTKAYEYEQHYRLIKKDLEILEILKKHIYFSSKSGCIRMKDIYKSINNFDYEELREWLKNEIHNKRTS